MINKENNLPQKKNSNKKTIIFSILMALIVCLSFIGGYFASELFKPKKVREVDNIVALIEQHGYIINPETGKPYDFTNEDYADAIVKNLLDRYCEYYTAEERNKSLQEGLGLYNGIGLTILEDSLAVFKVIGNSPADLAGVKKGDVIIAGITPDQTRIDFSTGKDVLNFLDSQEKSDTVTLIFDGEIECVFEKQEYFVSYVTYYDSEKRLCFRTEDTQFSEPSDEMSAILDDDTAYIKLDQFEGSAALQLKVALSFMEERGRTKLILDLRDNGGGYMTVLTSVASMLIKNQGKNNTLVAVSRGKTGEEEYKTSINTFNDNIKAISVIANEYTASASECLIGAMLHYGDFFSKDRLILERNSNNIARTYGKGIMQSTFPLADGAAIKITTASILWPDRTTCIHGKGITTTAENSVEKGVGAILRAQATLN